jgi:hypothetical protein
MPMIIPRKKINKKGNSLPKTRRKNKRLYEKLQVSILRIHMLPSRQKVNPGKIRLWKIGRKTTSEYFVEI